MYRYHRAVGLSTGVSGARAYACAHATARITAATSLLLLAAVQVPRGQSAELPNLSPQQVRTLHLTLLDSDYERRGDPAPARLLSRMYAAGNGVPKDEIAACALARQAQGAAMMRKMSAGEDLATYDRLRAEAEAFTTVMCGGLSSEQQALAGTSVVCLAIGMPEDIVQLGTTSVRVGRGGIGLLDAPPERVTGLPNCPVVVIRARAVTVLPSPISAATRRPRHFVEVIYWNSSGPEGGRFSLQLLLFELRDERFDIAVIEPLKRSSDWPNSPVDIRVWYEMQTDGRILFEMDGDIQKRRYSVR